MLGELELSPGNEPPPETILRWLGPRATDIRWRSLAGAGGFSGARFWRGDQVSGTPDALSKPLCLRAWPEAHPTDDRLQWIHDRLRDAGHLPFVPLPHPGRDGRTWIRDSDRRWECSDWMPGAPIQVVPPDESRLEQAFRAVAKLHLAWRPAIPQLALPPAVLERRAAIDRWLTTDLAAIRRVADGAAPLPLRSVGLAVLPLLPGFFERAQRSLRRWERRPFPLQPSVRDLWSAHLLFVDDAVTGIVDFGAMRIDSVATDLGRLAGSFGEENEWAWSVAQRAYETVAGRNAELWELARDLERIGLGIGIAQWLNWLWLEGRRFEDLAQVEQRLTRQIARLERSERIERSR